MSFACTMHSVTVKPHPCSSKTWRGFRQVLVIDPPASLVHATSMSKQHLALVPSIFAPLILAVCFSIRSAVCHVCFLIPWF